jgi:hypothetical protein
MFALTNPLLGGLAGDPFGGVLLHLTPASVFHFFKLDILLHSVWTNH